MKLTRSRRLLLDTCAVVYFLQAIEPYYNVMVPLFQRVQEGSLTVVISAVTEAELHAWPQAQSNEIARERIMDLLSEHGIEVVPVSRRIARMAGALRGRDGYKLMDAIIIATASETGCEAIVSNDGEWARKQVNPPLINLQEIVARA